MYSFSEGVFRLVLCVCVCVCVCECVCVCVCVSEGRVTKRDINVEMRDSNQYLISVGPPNVECVKVV